jgi:hypothetical protein
LVGASDSDIGIFSCWLQAYETIGAPDNSTTQFYANVLTGNFKNQIIQAGGNGAGFFSRDNLSVNSIEDFYSPFVDPGNGWQHLIVGWDRAASRIQIYLDDVDVTTGPPTVGANPIDWDGPDEHYVMAQDLFGAVGPKIDVADFYLDIDATFDLSVAANRRKFITSGGNPVSLGADGSEPTGAQPIIFLSGDAAAWNAGNANKGYGGAFTVTGELADAPSLPGE